MNTATRNLIIILVAVICISCLIAFAMHLHLNRFCVVVSADGQAYEVDRRTGKSWRLWGGQKIPQTNEILRTRGKLPAEELMKLQKGNVQMSPDPYGGKHTVTVDVHNSGDWQVEEMVFTITYVKDVGRDVKDPEKLSRDIRVKAFLAPFGSAKVPVEVGDPTLRVLACSLKSATGYPPEE